MNTQIIPFGSFDASILTGLVGAVFYQDVSHVILRHTYQFAGSSR